MAEKNDNFTEDHQDDARKHFDRYRDKKAVEAETMATGDDRNRRDISPTYVTIGGDSTNHRRKPKRAPIVGWYDDSPTVFPSSPCKTPDLDGSLDRMEIDGRSVSVATSSSKSSGICQDSGNTEDLSSLADEKLLGSTPALTIDRSVESLSPDKDTLLTTSPDIAAYRESSLDDDDSDIGKFDFLSPGTEFTEDGMPATSIESYPTLSSFTIASSPPSATTDHTAADDKPIIVDRTSRSELVANGQNVLSDREYRRDDARHSDAYLPLMEDSDNTAKDKTSRKKAKIPDGGWGWMVVLSSLIISMIADGVSFSFGLLYIEFLEEFQSSKSKTAWIGSLFMAVPLLSGPVMSALVDRYGCRNMTILGGLISGLGFVLSSFANSIEIMYLTFGIIAGLGLGLCYVTAVVSIAYWFDKKRNLAVGLGACGTGIGTFVYAPMTTYFIDEYGWRGTCLLLAGTFFNMIVCGAVMRDPEWWILEQKKQQELSTPRKAIDRSNVGSDNSLADETFPDIEELRRLLKNGRAPEYLLQNLSTSMDTPNDVCGGSIFRSVVNLPTFVKQSEKVPLEVLESLSSNTRLYKVILQNYPNILMCRSLSDKKLEDSAGEINKKRCVTMSMRVKQAKTHRAKDDHPPSESIDPTTRKNVPDRRRSSPKKDAEANYPPPPPTKEIASTVIEMAERGKSVPRCHSSGLPNAVARTDSLPPLKKQFSANTHYFKDIRVHRNSVMYRGAALNLHKYRLRASSCPNIYKNSMTTLAKENEEKWYSEVIDLLKGMVDFSMFLELHFFLLSLSTILLFTWFIVPYFYLAEHLTRNGYTESDAANLLSIIGITNTIGMIGLGWAGDQPWMNVSKTYSWCLIACGIATILMSVFTHRFVLLTISSAAFGLFFASSFSFTPVILVELIPLERFTTAYGLCLLCQGIGNLLGPPLSGWFFDVTNSWDLSFTMAGSWIIVSGILVGVVPYTKNRKMWGSGPVRMELEKDSLP